MKFSSYMKHSGMMAVAVMAGFHLFAAPATAPVPADSGSPFTNAIPHSTFTESDPYTTRDPFSPINYKRIPPVAAGAVAVQENVDPQLEVNSITIAEEGSIAILKDKTMLEIGSSYKYKDPKSKAVVEYRVVSIADSGIIISYPAPAYDQEKEFPLKSSSLERFFEKEEPPAKEKEGTP